MPICGCSSGIACTALAMLLLLPAQYLLPDLVNRPEDAIIAKGLGPPEKRSVFNSVDLILFSTLDFVFTATLLFIAFVIYIFEWIQRKLMEKRITKLNQHLKLSMERLRSLDLQQSELESTLKTVQNATSEYNLLLYLLLHHRRCLGNTGPPNN